MRAAMILPHPSVSCRMDLVVAAQGATGKKRRDWLGQVSLAFLVSVIDPGRHAGERQVTNRPSLCT